MERFFIILLATVLFTAPPARAGYFDCSVVYDEFESLMNKQFLIEPDRYVGTILDRLTQEDYQRLQKGRFTLYADRADTGIIIFRTNENLHGKLLYHFSEKVGEEVHLLIDEAVVLARVEDGFGPVRIGPIRLKPGFGLDLDSGNSYVMVEQGATATDKEKEAQDRADLAYRADVDSGTFTIEAVNRASLVFPTETLCHRPGAGAGKQVPSPLSAPRAAAPTSPAQSMPLPPPPPVSDDVRRFRLPGQP